MGQGLWKFFPIWLPLSHQNEALSDARAVYNLDLCHKIAQANTARTTRSATQPRALIEPLLWMLNGAVGSQLSS